MNFSQQIINNESLPITKIGMLAFFKWQVLYVTLSLGGRREEAGIKEENSMLFFVKLTLVFKVEDDGVRPLEGSGYQSNLYLKVAWGRRL